MKNSFDINRLVNFIKRQLILNISSFWIALGAIVGILLIISLLVAYFEPMNIYNLPALYMVVFFISGYIFTSVIFSEMNTPQKSFSFLTIPVSNLEKIIGSWIITSPLFIITYIILMYIIFAISATMAGMPHAVANLLTHDIFVSLGIFMVVQTVFFLGACTFKGNNFLKTLFSLFILANVLGIYTGILGWTVIGFNNSFEPSYEFQDWATSFAETVFPILFWYVLGPFMVVVSYFKLKERQV